MAPHLRRRAARSAGAATLAAGVLAAALGGCASDGVAAVPGVGEAAAAVAVEPGAMPAELGGLRTQEEDVTAQLDDAGPDTYVTGLQLWSLRDGERLRATLQVARFAPDARPDEREFTDRVAGQIGRTDPRVRYVDGHRVYVSSGDEQVIYVWFEGLRFAVLTVSADHPEPRTLLRSGLGVIS